MARYRLNVTGVVKQNQAFSEEEPLPTTIARCLAETLVAL